jgi:hypothetical protein
MKEPTIFLWIYPLTTVVRLSFERAKDAAISQSKGFISHGSRCAVGFLILILFFGYDNSTIAAEKPITPEQIATLLESGFKSEDVLKEVQARGLAGSLDTEITVRLRKAGASTGFILSLMDLGAKASDATPAPTVLISPKASPENWQRYGPYNVRTCAQLFGSFDTEGEATTPIGRVADRRLYSPLAEVEKHYGIHWDPNLRQFTRGSEAIIFEGQYNIVSDTFGKIVRRIPSGIPEGPFDTKSGQWFIPVRFVSCIIEPIFDWKRVQALQPIREVLLRRDSLEEAESSNDLYFAKLSDADWKHLIGWIIASDPALLKKDSGKSTEASVRVLLRTEPSTHDSEFWVDDVSDDLISDDPAYDSPAMRTMQASTLFQIAVLSGDSGGQVSGNMDFDPARPFLSNCPCIGVKMLLGNDWNSRGKTLRDFAGTIGRILRKGVQKYNELVAQSRERDQSNQMSRQSGTSE